MVLGFFLALLSLAMWRRIANSRKLHVADIFNEGPLDSPVSPQSHDDLPTDYVIRPYALDMHSSPGSTPPPQSAELRFSNHIISERESLSMSDPSITPLLRKSPTSSTSLRTIRVIQHQEARVEDLPTSAVIPETVVELPPPYSGTRPDAHTMHENPSGS